MAKAVNLDEYGNIDLFALSECMEMDGNHEAAAAIRALMEKRKADNLAAFKAMAESGILHQLMQHQPQPHEGA